MRFVRLPVLSGICAAVALAGGAHGATFTGLRNPFPDGYVAHCAGVSADGGVVVGYTYKPVSPDFGDRSFRWRRGIGFDNPGPTQGAVLSYAAAVSANGNVIAGNTGHAFFGDQEAWVRVGTSRGHVGSPPGTNFSSLLGVSGDGVVTVGFGGDSSDPNSARAAYYNTVQDRWTSIGFLPGGVWSKAFACSANGAVIVGRATTASVGGSSAFVWTQAGGMEPVGTGNLPGGESAVAVGVSADGSVIVGMDDVRDENYNASTHGWRWTAQTGMVDLGEYWVSGVSPDGRVIVGSGQVEGIDQALIWDVNHGWRTVSDLLTARGLAPDMSGWQLSSADSINQVGDVYALTGDAGDPDGYIAGWVATIDHLDAPCPVIVSQPGDQSACGASGAVFHVDAFSDQAISYQWKLNGAELPEQTEATLVLSATSSQSAGEYTCQLTTACGSVSTAPALLTVCASDLDCSGQTDTGDLVGVLAAFGAQAQPGEPWDLNGDGVVNTNDLTLLLAGFGTRCP